MTIEKRLENLEKESKETNERLSNIENILTKNFDVMKNLLEKINENLIEHRNMLKDHENRIQELEMKV